MGVPLRRAGRVEVVGRLAGRRRVWTLEQKLALVLDMQRCNNIAAFARKREIGTALLYTWRRELRRAMKAAKLPPRDEPMFVPVVGGSPPSSSDSSEVEVGGAVLRIGQAVRAVLAVIGGSYNCTRRRSEAQVRGAGKWHPEKIRSAAWRSYQSSLERSRFSAAPQCRCSQHRTSQRRLRRTCSG